MNVRGITIDSPSAGPVTAHVYLYDVSGEEISMFETFVVNRITVELDFGLGLMRYVIQKVEVFREDSYTFSFFTLGSSTKSSTPGVRSMNLDALVV